MGERWPSMRGAKLARIIEKHCGSYIRRSGSPRRYRGRQKEFTFAYHDGAEVSGNNVRRILIDDVGLTATEARKEVS
jgi:predicted RNA binding protein YcfA (HicA-like mRNA interferase family)